VNVLLIPIILAVAFMLPFVMAWLEPERRDPLTDVAAAEGSVGHE
jgi:hypothetical protein